jgi:hypothetical protein
MKKYITKRNAAVLVATLVIVGGGFFLFSYTKNNKALIAIKSLGFLNKVSKLIISGTDTQKEIAVLDQLVQKFTAKDGQTRTFMFLLQNNMELRPGGGFLGQYAIFKIKDGQIVSSFFEDANLLDQKIEQKITPPYPLTRMMQIKKWKFRDSNFSPDFPTNVEKAEYFYRLAGGGGNFDGVIAVNASVLDDVLDITGPITIPGYGLTLTKGDAVLKLEEVVEKKYIMDPELDTQNRKEIMKSLTDSLSEKLMTFGNISKLAEFAHVEMQKKNIMLNFSDAGLQKSAESVFWAGEVAKDWGGDYLMLVDANMGALKTDYYIKRELSYNVDLTQTKPVATVNYLYKNTAAYGDWRTSDYHTYLRIYTPKGSNFLERKMVGYPNISEEFNKTAFGVLVHSIINNQTDGILKYELPESIDKKNYRLLIQKQSGVDDVPVKVHVKSDQGEFDQEAVLNKDLIFEFQSE